MRIQQINRSDAEKVFGMFYNASASTMAAGTVAQLVPGASADGNQITIPTTNYLDLVVGIVSAAITTLDYGFVQMYGISTVALVNSGTTVSVAAGMKMVPIAGSVYLNTLAAGDGRDGFFAMLKSLSTLTSTSAGFIAPATVFIRCM